MVVTRRVSLTIVGLLGSAIAVSAQPSAQSTPAPLFPRVANAIQSGHRTVPVPPTLEIEVLDPNVDPRGNPAVLTRPAPVPTPGGFEQTVVVDIPPTVLVHRYYYSGDRSFQAQLLPGGPCIVVASHPRSGERLYIPVQFPPGAPRVTYTDDSIEYDYGTQTVKVQFCCLLSDRPKVTYCQGITTSKRLENAALNTRDGVRRVVNRTALPELVDTLATGSKNMFLTTIDRVNDLGERLLAPPRQLIQMTPLKSLFSTPPEDRAMQERDALIRRAQQQIDRQNITLPTIR